MTNWYIIAKQEKYKIYKKKSPILVLSEKEKKERYYLLDSNGYLHTINGKIKLSDNDVICRGLEGELWTQEKKDLIKKYKLNKKTKESKWQEWTPVSEFVKAKKMNNKWKLKSLDGHDEWEVENKLFNKTYEIEK